MQKITPESKAIFHDKRSNSKRINPTRYNISHNNIKYVQNVEKYNRWNY